MSKTAEKGKKSSAQLQEELKKLRLAVKDDLKAFTAAPLISKPKKAAAGR